MKDTVNINDTLSSAARSDAGKGFMEKKESKFNKEQFIEFLKTRKQTIQTSNPNIKPDDKYRKLINGYNWAIDDIIEGLQDGFQIDNAIDAPKRYF